MKQVIEMKAGFDKPSSFGSIEDLRRETGSTALATAVCNNCGVELIPERDHSCWECMMGMHDD
jgi:hypothetical protein